MTKPAPSPPVQVLTSTQMAAALGINRSTLVRLEQRGILPKAPITPPPHSGRVYDAVLVNLTRKAYAKYRLTTERKDMAERPDAPRSFVKVERFA